MEKERIKRIIQYIIIIIIGCIIGYKTTNADTIGVPNSIIFKTTGEQTLTQCNNSDYCFGYNFNSNANPNNYAQIIYNYNFNANQTYYISFNGYFGFGYGGQYEYALPENFNGQITAGIYGTNYGVYLNCAPTINYYSTSYGNVYWDDNYVGNSNYINVTFECSVKTTSDANMLALSVLPSPSNPIAGMFVRESNLLITTNESEFIVNNDNKNHKETIEKIEEIKDVLESGEFTEPNKNDRIEDLEEEESALQNILGVPNYDNLKIDISANASTKIWELLERILAQNNMILTMVITILSISIIKLVLAR